MNTTKLLTHKAASKLLGIHSDTFRKWVNREVDPFPVVKMSEDPIVRTKILLRDVEDYLAWSSSEFSIEHFKDHSSVYKYMKNTNN